MAQSNRKNFAVVDEEADSVDAAALGAAPEAVIDMNAPVGRILAQAREHAGYSLYDVAATLRIRAGLLDAIEAGRHGDLPGSVYAIGFVRAYAEFLGFNGDQMVSRFKRESVAVKAKPDLVFPAPVPEGSRVPGGAILMIAVLIGGLAYAGWYYLSSANRDVAAEIAALPARFSALLDGGSQPAANPGPVVQPAAPNDSTPVPRQATAPNLQPGPGERMTAGPVVPGPTAPAGTPPLVSPVMTAAVAAQPPAPAPSAVAPSAVAAAQAVTEPVAPPSTPIPSLADRPLGAALANEPPAPQVPVTGAGRIVLRASADSWVQIRDKQGGLVMTRVMASGESYDVPQQDGLRLVTGNAGGLQIEIDGQIAPPLGGPGQVIRNVALDAQKLRGGQAATN